MKHMVISVVVAVCVNAMLLGVELAADIELALGVRLLIVLPIVTLVSMSLNNR